LFDALVLITEQAAAGRAEPYDALAIDEHRPSPQMLHSESRGNRREAAIAVTDWSRIGTDPQTTVGGTGDAPCKAIVQSFGLAERSELGLTQPV
jgi:hypothetical protein